jgi:hypothetical protein
MAMSAPLSVLRGLAFFEGRLSIGVSCAKLPSYHFEAGIRPLGGINVPDPMDLSVVSLIDFEDRTTPFWRDNTCALAGFLNLGPLGWRIQG